MSTFETAAGRRQTQKSRRVGLPLAIGIVLLPIVFAWFTLRAGYSLSARVISFAWLVLTLIVFATAGEGGSQSAASGGSEDRTFSQVATDALVNPQMNAITDKVARDSVDQYGIAQTGGDKTEICVRASLVVAAFLQAKDQTNYLKWKNIERADCDAAGMPRRD